MLASVFHSCAGVAFNLYSLRNGAIAPMWAIRVDGALGRRDDLWYKRQFDMGMALVEFRYHATGELESLIAAVRVHQINSSIWKCGPTEISGFRTVLDSHRVKSLKIASVSPGANFAPLSISTIQSERDGKLSDRLSFMGMKGEEARIKTMKIAAPLKSCLLS